MKVKYFKACIKRGANMSHFPDNVVLIEAEGHYAHVRDADGVMVEFALEYDRSTRQWYGTSLMNGLTTRPLGGKTKEDLLHKLSQYRIHCQFENKQNQILIKMIEEAQQ